MRTRALAMLAPLALAACALVLRPTPTERVPYVRFSHARHVPRGAPASSCASCHQQPDSFEQVQSRGHPACASCHRIGDRPGPSCAFCHRSESPGPPPVEPSSTFLFSHGAHQWLILDATSCAPCHEVDKRHAEARTLASEERCVECHRDRGASARCETCHVGLGRSTLPESHREASFLREHRRLADQTCGRCHAASFCQDCHSRDHTPLWKRASHGLDALRDTRVCARCHEADQCDRCHTTVRPPDHLAADWRTLGHAMPARLATRRCVVCHEAQSECGECH